RLGIAVPKKLEPEFALRQQLNRPVHVARGRAAVYGRHRAVQQSKAVNSVVRDNHIWLQRQNLVSHSLEIVRERNARKPGINHFPWPVRVQALLYDILQQLGPGFVALLIVRPKVLDSPSATMR